MEFAVERAAGDAEEAGGGAAVVAGAAEGFADERVLHGGEVEIGRGGGGRGGREWAGDGGFAGSWEGVRGGRSGAGEIEDVAAAERVGEVAEEEFGAGAHDDPVFDGGAEFADIAWPAVAGEGFHGFEGDFADLAAVFFG